MTQRLTSTVWGSFSKQFEEKRFHETGFSPDNPEIARLRMLVDRLLGAPRHLSQHVGGFVLTQGRLDETVPIHNGAMEGRTFIEWDKDDIDELKIMKVDILALGMLTCIRKAFDLMAANGLARPTSTRWRRTRTSVSTRCCKRATASVCSRWRAGRRSTCCPG